MRCGSCGERVPAGAAFCHRCGSPQSGVACSGCGVAMVQGAAFCSSCGTAAGTDADDQTPTPLSSSGAERRLTSVMFADLVDHSSLSEARDSEDVRDLLTAYFDICGTVIRRYGGTVEKFIGDAVMAVWGVPTAHEDDAERAVRAGLTLVDQVVEMGERIGTPLRLRVGVVTGEVAATLGAQDQGMVAGDPVNTAARVQSTASPGEVWVDATTRSMTSASVTYEDVGAHALKGKADPLRLYRAGTVVAAVGGAQRVDGLEAPLVGRERQLRLVQELFHATEESGRSQLVVLDGEAGVGKTRLGWEFEKYVDGLTRGVAWHRGRCLSYGDRVAFWALAEAVRARVGLLENETGAVVGERLDRLLADRVADESERQWVRPRIASLLGEESREYEREDLFAAWAVLFERVGAEDPVVLLIDDAEHLDEGLGDFLEFLIARPSIGCFVLLLARPELLAARPTLGGRRTTTVRVDPLPAHAMRELVDGLAGGLSDVVRDGLVARAAGIPLFAVETVRALIDRELVVPVDGRYVVAPGRTVDLSTVGAPASLHALVAARLDALAPDERRVLSEASVLGEVFPRERIRVLAAGVADLDGVLERLTRKELLATETDPFSTERGQLRFVQSVVHQVAYGTLSRRNRKSRHLLIADHLLADTERGDDVAPVIAQHLLDAAESCAADDPDVSLLRTRAADLLVRAADRASSLGAHADAVRSQRTALAFIQGARERAAVLKAQATVQLKQNRYLDGLEAATEAVALFDEVGDRLAAADSAYYAARAAVLADRLDEAIQLTREHLDVLSGLDGGGDRDLVRGRLASMQATAFYFAGRIDEVFQPLHEALRISDRVDDFEMFRNACNILGHVQSVRGSHRVSILLAEELAELAREREDWIALSTALGNVGIESVFLDLGKGFRLNQEAVSTMTEHGMAPLQAHAINLLHYSWMAGDWDEFERLAADPGRLVGDSPVRDCSAVAFAALCTWAGRPVSSHVDDLDADLEDQIAVGLARAGRLLDLGDLDGAVSRMRAVVAQEVALFGASDDLHVYWPVAVRLALEAGDDDGLRELWQHHELILQVFGGVNSLVGHVRVFGALLAMRDAGGGSGRHLDRIESDLREGIDILDRTGCVVWRAHAQEDLGRWLLGVGRGDQGEEWLAAARDTYTRLGAVTWLARLEAVQAVG